MKPSEILKEALKSELVDDEGAKISLEIAPPQDKESIEKLESEYGCPLPDDVRDLVQYCSGIEGLLAEFDLTGALMFELDLFPHGMPIAGDGFGNFWVADITHSGAPTAVYFACHDPPVIVYQAPSISDFLVQALKTCKKPWKSEVTQVCEEYAMQVWTKNDGVLSREEALAGDADMKAFAETLTDDYQFIDMRNAAIGQGFSWGRYGATTVSKRYGEKLIFAYQKKALSWWQKIFGV